MTKPEISIYNRMVGDEIVSSLLRQVHLDNLDPKPDQEFFNRLFSLGPTNGRKKEGISEERALYFFAGKLQIEPASVRTLFENIRFMAESSHILPSSDTNFAMSRVVYDDGTGAPRKSGKSRRGDEWIY